MANLHFFYGTMAAGKSAKLLQDRYNFIQKNATVWVIKPRTDRTSEPKITSRIGLECPAEIMDNIIIFAGRILFYVKNFTLMLLCLMKSNSLNLKI